MFIKSSLIAFALVLSASATPLVDGLGIPIAFEKRIGLSSSSGIFDHAKAAKQVVRNRNAEFMNKRAYIPPIANITDKHQNKRQAEKLTDYDNDVFWGGPVTIGSNKGSLLIDLDTGSSDLWVPSSKCKGSACKSKKRYDAATSTTSVHKPATFTIEYGDVSKVSGPVNTDTPVTTLSATFAGEEEDGVLGLAFPEISNLHQSSFFITAKAQGPVKPGVFAFKLDTVGSELYLGDRSAVVNGEEVVESGAQAIVDSGTTIIYGPPAAIAALYKTIPESRVYDAANDVGDLAVEGRVGNMCIGAVAGVDLGLGDNVWLLGDSFMKNVYSVFSMDKKVVGFTRLKE
ncbi:aspartic peptidase domain-containing protein [Daedaleopsis nitida]|nr:aspartic peptidase domain-containing protein [Daedaleopsis nitida]